MAGAISNQTNQSVVLAWGGGLAVKLCSNVTCSSQFYWDAYHIHYHELLYPFYTFYLGMAESWGKVVFVWLRKGQATHVSYTWPLQAAPGHIAWVLNGNRHLTYQYFRELLAVPSLWILSTFGWKVCITFEVFEAVGLVSTIIPLACGMWKARHFIFRVYPHSISPPRAPKIAQNTFGFWLQTLLKLKPEHGSHPAYPTYLHWNLHHVYQELLLSIW